MTLPWAPAFGWLTGAQCPARLSGVEAWPIRRVGRCELRHGHTRADDPAHRDHALEMGMETVRWPHRRAYAEPS